MIGDDLREYYFSAPPQAVFLDTLELRHPAFDQPARIVNDLNDFVATLEADAPANAGQEVTFIGCPFEALPPESTDQGLPQCTLQIMNVTKLLMPQMAAAIAVSAPVEISFRQYLADDPSEPQLFIHGLTAKVGDAGILRVQVTAGFEDLLNKPFPFRLYTSKEFPTLVR